MDMRLPALLAGGRIGESLLTYFTCGRWLHQKPDLGHLLALQFVHDGQHRFVPDALVAGDQHRLLRIGGLRLADPGRPGRRAATTCSALPLARSRMASEASALMMTSSGATGGWLLLPTLGRSTLPVWIIGAVTMKITSSTSITSM
jgi:hypothetical protein